MTILEIYTSRLLQIFLSPSMSIGFSLLFGFVFGIFSPPLETFIHETGHSIGILLCRPKKYLNGENLTIAIYTTINPYFSSQGITVSNFLSILSDNKMEKKHLKHIRKIALSGFVFSVIFYILVFLSSIFLVLSTLTTYFMFLGGISVFFIIRAISTLIGSSDLRYIRFPEQFEYNPTFQKYDTPIKFSGIQIFIIILFIVITVSLYSCLCI